MIAPDHQTKKPVVSIATHVISDEAAAGSEILPAAVLIGALLLLGAWAMATGNFDMGWMSSSLLIGP